MILYYPTIPALTPPAHWSPRKTAMYTFLRQARRLPRTKPGFYVKLGKSFKKEASIGTA
jgi:hypothetical protein